MTIDRLPHALAFVSAGFAVFPCNTIRDGRCSCGNRNCENPGKHPIGRPGWAPNGHNSATTRDHIVRYWWGKYPIANIGIALRGAAVVLDVDPRNGGDESLRTIEDQYGPLPHTWRCLTGGGGEHIFFAPPSGVEVRSSNDGIARGLDIKASGGYVIGAGSAHVSGRDYEWSVDHHPEDTPLAPMPTWMLDHAKAQLAAAAKVNWQQFAASSLQEGERDKRLTQLSGLLIGKYVEPFLALELISAFNAARCVPPLPEAQVYKIVNSIAARELRKREVRFGRR